MDRRKFRVVQHYMNDEANAFIPEVTRPAVHVNSILGKSIMKDIDKNVMKDFIESTYGILFSTDAVEEKIEGFKNNCKENNTSLMKSLSRTIVEGRGSTSSVEIPASSKNNRKAFFVPAKDETPDGVRFVFGDKYKYGFTFFNNGDVKPYNKESVPETNQEAIGVVAETITEIFQKAYEECDRLVSENVASHKKS